MVAKVSVIIPVYNVEKYLVECLNSVISQTLREIEIICVNDGSKDGSLKILKEYAAKDDRITIINQENQGLSCARNNALKIAKGEYIQFLDSDDYLKLDAVEKLYDFAKKNNLDLCSFSGENFIDGEYKLLKNEYWSFGFLPQNFNCQNFNWSDCMDFITRMPVSSCLTIYRNVFIKKLGLEFPSGLCYEDNVFYTIALLSANTCGILKEKLYCRRIHKNAITQNWNKHFADYLAIIDILLSWIKKNKNILFQPYGEKLLGVVVRIYNGFLKKEKEFYYENLIKLLEKYILIFIPMALNWSDGNNQLRDLRNSTSWKIGRIITWLPRKIKVASRVLKTMMGGGIT